ncbi:hypothetical protein [Streptomyces sp. RKAG290]|uniref:hypothetical protein n=1 Tax=Streptomyces sp. RKAG290 TaxID=2888348 RepID=UPI002033CD57|nr:hypothetical protein [Streptomyces sp. RKAG290]MCM2416368.1 hypothetical protein [Streptomyces sp. RKAG290]
MQNKPRQWTSLKALDTQEEGDRTEIYPLQAGPRIDRAMVFDSLLNGLKKPDKLTELVPFLPATSLS